MEYSSFVVDFSERTLRNLDAIHELGRAGKDVYPVTQLWNSLLGLIVLPRESDEIRIPRWRMSRLYAEGWPRITLSEGHENMKLSSLVWNLRNAVAHFNVTFMADHEHEISSITVWTSATDSDGRPIKSSRDWEARIDIDDLERLARKIAETYVRSFRKAA